MTFFSLLARAVTGHPAFIDDVLNGDRLPSIFVETLLLQYNAPYMGLLSKYVFFLLFAFVAVAALKRNRTGLVVVVSIAIYIVSQLLDRWLPPGTGRPISRNTP